MHELRFRAHYGDTAPTKISSSRRLLEINAIDMIIIRREKKIMWEENEISEDVMLITFFSILASFITITLTT